MGQYLPDWHHWEDYRQVYFSKKETGACREMLPFELIWLNWLFESKVSEIVGSTNKISDLKMDADDIFFANLKYKNGILGNMIIDLISRKPLRTLRILGSNGVLEWEKYDSIIKLYETKSRNTKIIKVTEEYKEKGYVNGEEMYNSEIEAFLDAIKGKKLYPHTFSESHYLLKTLYALEESSRTGSLIKIKD
jgi:predicted dehydrogenase